MEKLLFINACPRPEGTSRTLSLCTAFLEKYQALHPDTEIIRRPLYDRPVSFYGAEEIALRDRLLAEKAYDHPMFRLAREFQQADKILIGAPYWDLSFPAILKMYIENICVSGITFRYTEHGAEGLCAAKNLLYVTTAGGFIGEKNFGGQYIKAVGELLGIRSCSFLAAEGLDVVGLDTSAILLKSIEAAKSAAEQF